MTSPAPTTASAADWAARNQREWTGLAASWRCWHAPQAASWQTTTDLLLEDARPRPGLRLLDVASGAGEPALTLARLVGPTGAAIVTDLVPAMLAVAAEHARAADLPRRRFMTADANALPFRDASFELVTCRSGVMFSSDLPRALGELRRVLRPGGHAIFTAWGAFDRNDALSATLGIVMQRVPPPMPEPCAPHPGRFSSAGVLAAALSEAGFHEVTD